MTNITLTLELPEKMEQALDSISSSLWTIAQAMSAGSPAPAAADHPAEVVPFPDPVPATTPAPAPAETPTPPWEDTKPEPVKTYTLQEVRDRVMALSRQGADIKAKVKEILNKYANSVPTLKPEDYPAFMEDLEDLSHA